MSKSANISVPLLIWPLAFAAGIGIAAGTLSYSPQGRINVLWVWLLWAALPLLGSAGSLVFALLGSSRPWLFQWRNRSLGWYPQPRQRLQMLWLLQLVWCLLALGMVLGYWLLLLLSDLAFGWSSTLIDDAGVIAGAVEWLAFPWRSLWPAAVPTADTVAATYFQRIAPATTEPALATDWWRFLMASLIAYNLMPRALLALLFYGRWRWSHRQGLLVHSEAPSEPAIAPQHQPVVEGRLADWNQALRLTWEYQDPALPGFGLSTWEQDEQRLAQLLAQQPKRLLWQVNATRSPVAELGDLVATARAGGVSAQALWARPDRATDPERHIRSWHSFARQHQLVWIVDE